MTAVYCDLYNTAEGMDRGIATYL